MSLQIRDRINLGFAVGMLAAVACSLALGCSDSSAKNQSLIGNGIGGCNASDPGCGDIGAECKAGSECATGSCSAGACVVDAQTGSAGSSSNSNSNIDNPFVFDGSTDPTPADAGSSGPDPACPHADVDFNRVTPTVMLLIDQSGSMTQSFDNGKNRWQTLTDTLTDPQNSLLAKLDSSVRFGMTLYTSSGGFGGNPSSPRTCPELRTTSNPAPRIGNFSAMSDLLNANGPKGDTPTAESIAAIAKQLTALGNDSPKSIILATDGDPDTCEDPNANNSDASKAKSVAAVTAAFASGIGTHVISVGNEVTQSHLKNLAVAGAGGDQNAVAYTALDTSGLVDAFNAIIGSVRTCDFKLNGTVKPQNASRGTVLLDGSSLTFGDPNGWEMPDQSTVRLLGTACAAVEADASGVSMSFPCDAIEIIPR